eukprot:1039760-Prorocentrum_minimum.AAC.5
MQLVPAGQPMFRLLTWAVENTRGTSVRLTSYHTLTPTLDFASFKPCKFKPCKYNEVRQLKDEKQGKLDSFWERMDDIPDDEERGERKPPKPAYPSPRIPDVTYTLRSLDRLIERQCNESVPKFWGYVQATLNADARPSLCTATSAHHVSHMCMCVIASIM